MTQSKAAPSSEPPFSGKGTGLTDADFELQAILRYSGDPVAGNIAELQITHCVVEYPQLGAPVLRLGQQLDVEFAGKRLKRNVTLSAVVMRRMEGPSERRYQLQFRVKPGQDANDVFSIFNRRRAYRAPAVTPIGVKVTPRGANAAVSKPAMADLADISATGIGLALSLDDDGRFGPVNEVTVELELPTRAGALALDARIVWRQLVHAKAVRWGLSFDPSQAQFSRKEDVVIDYVMKYQKQTLKYRG